LISEIADEDSHKLSILDQAAAKGDAAETIARCRVQCRYRRLGNDDEPLCRSMRTEAEGYRFTRRRSFDGDAVVRIGRQSNEITSRWACRRFKPRGVDDAPSVVTLTRRDWERLQDPLIAASFWTLDPDGIDWPVDGDEQRTIAAIIASRGLDGSDWRFEGRRKDIYRAVSRLSPRAALYELGRLFFELAGPPLAKVRIY
jgi:hypothetical protein